MTTVLFQNVRGAPQGEPITLDRRRRRLSAILAKHASKRRPFMVSVHRQGQPAVLSDSTVREQADWSSTLISRDDTVLITYLPMGGGAAGGGRSQGKSIGVGIAAVAAAAALPLALPALGLSAMATTIVGGAVAVGDSHYFNNGGVA